MPSLQLAQRYGEITSSVGFDWNTPQQVLRKVKEELREFEQALKQKSKSSIHSELGDVLFTIANLARHLSVDSETVLKNAAYKFATRFEKIEKLAKRQRRKLSDFSADELEKLWKRVKNS